MNHSLVFVQLMFLFSLNIIICAVIVHIVTHLWTEEARRHALRYRFRNRYIDIGRRGSLYPKSHRSDKTLSSRLLGTDLEAKKIFILLKRRCSCFFELSNWLGNICTGTFSKEALNFSPV